MEQILVENWWLILILSLWTIPWKGAALWKAARAKDMVWFVIILLVNTLGILEIIYIFLISKKISKNTPSPVL